MRANVGSGMSRYFSGVLPLVVRFYFKINKKPITNSERMRAIVLTASVVLDVWVSCVSRDASADGSVVCVDAGGVLGARVEAAGRHAQLILAHLVQGTLVVGAAPALGRRLCHHCGTGGEYQIM